MGPRIHAQSGNINGLRLYGLLCDFGCLSVGVTTNQHAGGMMKFVVTTRRCAGGMTTLVTKHTLEQIF